MKSVPNSPWSNYSTPQKLDRKSGLAQLDYDPQTHPSSLYGRVQNRAGAALVTLTECQPLADLAARYQLDAAQITRWKLQLRE